METNIICRMTVPAAVAAAAVGIPADLYHFSIDSRAAAAHTVLFKTHGALLVLAMGLLVVVLAGLVLRLAGPTGRLPAVAAVASAMAFAGTLLALGNISTEAFALPQAGTAVSDPAGYWLYVVVASFGLLAAGWLGIAIALAQARLVSRRTAVFLGLGSVVAFTPLPGAYVLLLAGVALVGLGIASREMGRSRAVVLPSMA